MSTRLGPHATDALFGGTHDEASRLDRLADLAVPELADACFVELLEGHASLHRVAARPSATVTLRPLDHGRGAVARALATRQTQLVLSDSFSESLDAAELAQARAFGARSLMVAPLACAAPPFGVVTFLHAGSGRVHDENDRTLATDLAHRAAAAVEVARTLHRAERDVSFRDELLGVVSHDLRNPLNAILGATSLLLASAGADESARRKLDMIARNVARMSRLIQDVLDVRSIRAGAFLVNAAPLTTAEVVRETVDLLQSVAADRGIRLQVGEIPGVDVLADRERIVQVLSILVGNALKFTPAGGDVWLRAGIEAEAVRFAVRDTGPGVPREQQAQVFDRGTQGSRGEGGGLALSLFIARGIICAHGGQIGVVSEGGGGSEFWFTLPRMTA